jgi:hypothetical protein
VSFILAVAVAVAVARKVGSAASAAALFELSVAGSVFTSSAFFLAFLLIKLDLH